MRQKFAPDRSHSPNGTLSHLFVLPSGKLVGLHRGPGGNAVIAGMPGGTFRSFPATDIRTMRDGGTTYVTTDEGSMFIPSMLRRGKEQGPPTWRGQPMVEVDEDDYKVDLSVPSIALPGASPAP